MNNDEIIYKIELLEAKLGYINACIASYYSLTLSKITNDIHQKLHFLKKTILENKDYIDIRDSIELKKEVEKLQELLPNKEIYMSGHKIACLLFEFSILIKSLITVINVNDDIKEYLQYVQEYTFLAGRYINMSLLCNENYIIENK